MVLERLLLAACVLVLAAADAPCNERKLHRDAVMLLASHVDVELGGVGAGKREVVGFQHLKPAEALLAAQALAHEDFNQAAGQVQRILEYQKPNGLLPHVVYGPSVPSKLRWISSNRTFHPGPAFWQQPLEDQKEENPSSPLHTSTISAPPVAADVAWEIFRLAPYDSVLGVRTTAVQFLCSVYKPLKKLQEHLFFTRRGPAPSSLLTARTRHEDAREIYRRESTVLESIAYNTDGDKVTRFGVEDVEFNALMLRSSLSLVNIGRVLLEHSSVCTGFTLSEEELLDDMKELHSMAKGLEGALIGTNTTQEQVSRTS
eukprot:jgi/Phyca11/537036/estExt2_fgenesh1_pg.C_PHYCAscaffold_720002